VTVGPAASDRVTLPVIADKHARGDPIVMVTAYDYPSAQIVDEVGVDLVLVGDTSAEVVLGYPATVHVSLDEMLFLTSAVRRGLRTPLLVGDLPFGSYEASNELAVETAHRFVKLCGCDAVKLERGGSSAFRARAIVESGVPVMGHVGVTPQSEAALGGRRAQGRTAARAAELLTEARGLQDAGCFAVVLEAVPAEVAALITEQLQVPTIGIGAGVRTSGQVLVWHDLLGIYEWRPRFAKAFAELRPVMIDALSRYVREVRDRKFPGRENEYRIDPTELEHFRALLGNRSDCARDEVA
jgi:3-methyl-2-oxobutanoate hydroxymethyltransferase